MLSPPVPWFLSASYSLYHSHSRTYVAAGEVTTLKHELGDNAVEVGALVVEGLARAALALLAGAESAEVLSGLFGDD
jgi:hypothetical protein